MAQHHACWASDEIPDGATRRWHFDELLAVLDAAD